MSKRIIECPQCGEEVLVDGPGQQVGALYVEIGYSTREAWMKLQQASEIVSQAASDMPLCEDLATVVRLLRQVHAEITTIADE